MEVGINTLEEWETTILRDGNCTWSSGRLECLIPSKCVRAALQSNRTYTFLPSNTRSGFTAAVISIGTIGAEQSTYGDSFYFCGITAALMIRYLAFAFHIAKELWLTELSTFTL
jgi:hypothetical protein